MTTEQQLDALIAALPTQLPPPTDDWQALANRIALTAQHSGNAPQSDVTPDIRQAPNAGQIVTVRQQTAANQPWYWLTGALAAGLAIVAVLLFKPVPQLAQPVAQAEPALRPKAMADGAELAMQLRVQREKLMARVGGSQLKQLHQVPIGFENWQQQLAIWQQASSQLENALQQQPANRRLLRQYQQLQQQQLRYMHKLTELSQAYS